MLWDHSRLYLIMDYVDLDLREHMDTDPDSSSLRNVKVSRMGLLCMCCAPPAARALAGAALRPPWGISCRSTAVFMHPRSWRTCMPAWDRSPTVQRAAIIGDLGDVV